MTIKQANAIAKEYGFKRGKGTYNGAAYWTDSKGRIVTVSRLAEMEYGA